MTDHTPESWQIDEDDPYEIVSVDYGGIAQVPNEPAENEYIMAQMRATTRRIVAAVNACAGISTEDLEAVGDGGIAHRLAEIGQHLDTYHDHTMRLFHLIDEHTWSRRMIRWDWNVISKLSSELLNLANALRPGETK